MPCGGPTLHPLLGGATNQFDAEGRAVSLWGTAAAYDALGREAAAGGEMVLYAPNGVKLGLMSGSTVEDIEIPLPGGSAAVYNASGLELYRSADWLGSAALTTTPGGGLASTDHYTPFGFDVTGAGAQYRGFSGQHQWTDTSHTGGQYDFMYREYNSEQGRWWTPDPAGLAAVDPGNPQSWNRYAYVAGTPLSATDPLGLDAWCTSGGCGQSGTTINVNGFPDLGMLLGGPSGNRGPGGCVVENRNPNGGGGHLVSTVYRPGERPRIEYVSAPDCGGGYYGGGGGGGGEGGGWQARPAVPSAPVTTGGPQGLACGVPAGAPPGMTAADAQLIWSDGSLGSYGTDSAAANIAALAAVTWYGETGFSMNPANNLTSGDYGPMQINRATWGRAPADVFGTIGALRFNGSMAANIGYAERLFETYFVPYFGKLAAGAYVSADGWDSPGGLSNGLALKRQGFWSAYSGVLLNYFSNRACFGHH